jgi:hypothetical protein
MATKYTNISRKIDRLAIIFHCKSLQNSPKLGFFVLKYAIWQPRIGHYLINNRTENGKKTKWTNFLAQKGLFKMSKMCHAPTAKKKSAAKKNRRQKNVENAETGRRVALLACLLCLSSVPKSFKAHNSAAAPPPPLKR